MALEHLDDVKHALAALKDERRRVVKNLAQAPNAHNRQALLEIVQTLKALREIEDVERSSS